MKRKSWKSGRDESNALWLVAAGRGLARASPAASRMGVLASVATEIARKFEAAAADFRSENHRGYIFAPAPRAGYR